MRKKTKENNTIPDLDQFYLKKKLLWGSGWMAWYKIGFKDGVGQSKKKRKRLQEWNKRGKQKTKERKTIGQ